MPCVGQPKFDTVLSVYTGNCGFLTQVAGACNDDSLCPPLPFYTLQSRVFFNAIGGVTYRIRVSGFGGASGSFALNLAQFLTPPPNDRCVNAITVGNGTYGFNTCGAITDGPLNCPANHDVWYRFIAPCAGVVSLSTCGSSFDTALAVYTGPCGFFTQVAGACNDNAAAGPCIGGPQSFLTFNATAGTTYLIRVGGPGNAVGPGRLTIIGPNPAVATCPPGGSPVQTRLFRVAGTSQNTPWAWCLSAPCCASVSDLNVPGVSPVGAPAGALAQRFVSRINAACGDPSRLQAVQGTGFWNSYFVIQMRGCSGPFVFRIGAAGMPCDNLCVVADVSGADPLPTTGPCSFNPDLVEEPLSGHDLNQNGRDDTIDIITGTSQDTNGNGIPDEAEGCLPPSLVAKPEGQTLEPGQPLTLSVLASGGGTPLSFQWRRDGINLTDDTRVAGATANVLTINPSAQMDTGFYDVVVSNACGFVTSPAVAVRVGGALPPVITHPAFSTNGFTLSVTTQGGVDYVVEFKNALSDPVWTPLTTLIGDGSEQTITEPLSDTPTRFFRVRAQ